MITDDRESFLPLKNLKDIGQAALDPAGNSLNGISGLMNFLNKSLHSNVYLRLIYSSGKVLMHLGKVFTFTNNLLLSLKPILKRGLF